MLEGPQRGKDIAEQPRYLMDARISCWMGLREGGATEMSRRREVPEINSNQIRQSGCTTRAHNLLRVLQMMGGKIRLHII